MFASGPNRRESIKCLLAAGLVASDRAVAQADLPAIPPHPRLIANTAQWKELSARRSSDPGLEYLTGLLLKRATSDLGKPPVERTLQGRRLLGVAREFIRRTLLWAFAFRLTGEQRFLDRARKEMLAVAAFPDWHPDHFLDVAEMTAGMAIGYDWLFDDLPPP